jgi:starvation-inducible DNA-binding protein
MPTKKSDGRAATRTSAARTNGNGNGNERVAQAQPLLNQRGREIQPYGTLRYLPIDLEEDARKESCELLNQILADSIILYNLYKKYHWTVAGPTFYQLHELFDKHAEEQLGLIDVLAERVQSLGGIAVGDPRHVAELTKIERPPDGAEQVPVLLSRLLEAHETIIAEVREAVERTDENGDSGTNDLLAGDVLRTHEKQMWFDAEHLVDTPLVRA